MDEYIGSDLEMDNKFYDNFLVGKEEELMLQILNDCPWKYFIFIIVGLSVLSAEEWMAVR